MFAEKGATMNIVEQNIATVSELCKRHKVRDMYLFGSILTEKFSSGSDIDFLVNFGQVDLFYYFDNYMGLKDALENLFERPVDLIEEKTVKNPVLRRSIDRNKKLIYG
jgi:predicted nucleotidyltransferase